MTTKVQINTVNIEPELASWPADGERRSLARDSSGRLWATYRSSTTFYVYATYSDDGGMTWTEEQVSPSASQGSAGAQIIMVDSADVPHIIWHVNNAGGVDDIRYINRSGGLWGVSEVIPNSNTSGVNGLGACIDSGDIFHLTYNGFNGTNTGHRHISGTTGSWNAEETVYQPTAARAAIAVDFVNDIYVVYRRVLAGPNDELRLRKKTGGVWQAPELIDNVGDPTSISIAIDSVDDLHVAWATGGYDTGYYQIRYRKRQGGVWQIPIQVKVEAEVHWSCLTLILDTSDNVWIVYQSFGIDEAIYYKKITGGVLGNEVLLDSGILRPNDNSSIYSGLWQRYPSSGVLPAEAQPAVLINDEVTWDTARLWFCASELLIQGCGLLDKVRYQTFAKEELTVTTPAITKLTLSVYANGTQAQRAEIEVLSNTIRWFKDGSTPSGDSGHQSSVGDIIVLTSILDIVHFRAISDSGAGGNATLVVHYLSN